MSPETKQILDFEGMDRALARMAHEVHERNGSEASLLLIGIRTRGVFLAQRMGQHLEKIMNKKIAQGILDITLYRDDLSEIGAQASVRETEISEDIRGRTVVLVDDVLFTGRTVRAALDAIHDFGRPKAIQLAVLVDRGHRELPIRADYVGKNIPTAMDEKVSVHVKECDEVDDVWVTPRGVV